MFSLLAKGEREISKGGGRGEGGRLIYSRTLRQRMGKPAFSSAGRGAAGKKKEGAATKEKGLSPEKRERHLLKRRGRKVLYWWL